MRPLLSGRIVLAMALGALASPSLAKTYAYTFGTVSGGAYCDGLTISNGGSGDGWSGNHTGCTDDDPAGGFTARIGGTTYLDINTTDNENSPGLFLTYLLEPKSRQWFLFTSTNDGGGFQLINEGMLIKGAPASGKRPGAQASTFRNPKAVDKPVFRMRSPAG